MIDFPLIKTFHVNSRVISFLNRKYEEYRLLNQLRPAENEIYMSDTGLFTDNLLEWEDREYQKFAKNKLVTMEVHNVTDADVLGNNPIYKDEKVVGRATGGDFGFRINKSIAIGMVKPELATTGQKLRIDILGKMHDATIIDESPYDPENKLLRA